MSTSDTATFEHLLLHAGWLRRFAVALVKDADAAEDIVQDTLVAAWQRPAESRGRPWLARVARNFAIDRWRSADRRQRREEAAAVDLGSVASPEELVGDREIHRAVADAVAGLAEPFRQTLVLHFFDGASAADIARGLGIPDGTVRWRLKEGIERVRRRLDARYGQSRESWVAALLPLLPRSGAPASGGERSRPAVTRPTVGRVTLHPITVAGLVVFVAGMVLMAIAVVSRLHAPSLRAGGASVAAPSPPIAPVTSLGAAAAPVRLDPRLLASSPTPEDSNPGPGDADAKSLFRELLEAIQAGAYDDWVAKGSAAFKANARAEALGQARTVLGPRLATGYQPSLLGQLRRSERKLWVFRLEFADGGDDALAYMTTDGWQVAGLWFPNPTP
jgi:RNA polymerase sigma factor (sigma-70 family)